MSKHGTEPGSPLTLGAYPTGSGIQFSLFSRYATELHLLLFKDASDTTPDEVYVLDSNLNKTGDVWHIHIQGLKPGQLYLYRVDGPHTPGKGHRFDFDAWLIDPYARALTHATPWLDWKRDFMPKCVVIDSAFDWEGDKPLNYPLKNCIIYETHLAGLTKHPTAKVSSPGSYQGVVELIPYFTQLGITSLEFLPVQEFNPHDVFRLNPELGKGLRNYWGYNTVAFFAPAAQYALNTDQGGQVAEFKAMVKALHKAGIEVILDVVFNHTAEGNENGPTYSFRGLDNSIYYILDETKGGYRNYSGCGNTLNCNHPIVRSLIINCIRYWVLDMHVDGFRFDLGSILGRDSNGLLLPNPPIIELLAEDPVLRNTKLIAEAWDAAGLYQVGSFHGERWAEWNDRYRDDIRRFWANDPRMISGLAMRLSGSSDLYSQSGRKPFHSINFITSHDGFTLNDLVSYEKKHNIPNGEDNVDGHNTNFSRNFGMEGPSHSKDIEDQRNRMVKNFLTTLLLSAGTPMLLGGDEFRRTQLGNNNAYCQDNEISWYDWSLANEHPDILRYYRELVLFRRRHLVFKRSEFFSGTDANDNGVSDISWLDENCKRMDWSSPRNLLAVLIDGHRKETKADKDDNDFLLMFNSGNQDVPFLLPMSPCGSLWHLKIDTAGVVDVYPKGESKLLTDQRIYWVSARSVVVLVSDLVHEIS
jgi:isoamylase